jgi:phage terminase small subunit
MPRKSSVSVALVSVNGIPSRLNAPATLSARERTIFVDVVAGCAPTHFRKSDLPLLAAYVEACALREQAAAELQREGPIKDGKCSPWLSVSERATRTIVTLSTKLKLSPQSRLANTIAPRAEPANAYERMNLENDEA